MTMKNLAHVTSAMKAVIAIAILSFITGTTEAQTTGFNQTGAGPYDYNTVDNWVASTINGTWDTSLTLVASQTNTFAADTTLLTGLTFNYAGNLALHSKPARREQKTSPWVVTLA